MAGVLRGLASSTHSRYAYVPLVRLLTNPCAALAIEKISHLLKVIIYQFIKAQRMNIRILTMPRCYYNPAICDMIYAPCVWLELTVRK